jgi:quercetin dioxygenase-like cupin family protein
MWELFLVDYGVVTFLVNGEEMVLTAGDAVLIEPSEVHELKNSASIPAVVTVTSWLRCPSRDPKL